MTEGFYWLRDSAGWVVGEFRDNEWRYRGEWCSPDYLERWSVEIGPHIAPPDRPQTTPSAG